jgi:hypothetical protein
MSESIIPRDKDYLKLSKSTSGYLEIPYFMNAELNRGYFCNNCLYFINGNDCAIVRKQGPDVQGKESDMIAPYGVCTLWFPDETKTY